MVADSSTMDFMLAEVTMGLWLVRMLLCEASSFEDMWVGVGCDRTSDIDFINCLKWILEILSKENF